MKKVLMFVLCTLLLCGSATIATANLIQNPGFESNDSSSDFAIWSESGPGNIVVSDYAHSDAHSAFLSLGLYTGEGTAAQLKQSFNYTGAGTYEFGAYFSFVSYDNPPGSWPKDQAGVTSSYDTGSGWLHPNEIWSIGSNLSWTQHPSGAPIYRSDWYLISDTFDLPPALAGTSGELYLYLQRYAGITGVNIDDAYVRRVPEPATVLLLGTGFLGFAVFGRKRLLKK